MKYLRYWKSVLAVVLCLVILLAQPLFAETVGELQDRADDIEQEKNEVSNKINETDRLIAEKEAELADINSEISDVESQIDELNTTIYTSTMTIESLEEDIAAKELEIEDDYEVLRGRIRTIYMSGGTSDLEVLLGAKSFDEFIDATALVKAVSKHDQKLINGLKNTIADINSEIEEVEENRKSLLEARQALETTRIDLDDLKLKADAAAAELRTLKGELTDEMHELTVEQEGLYAQIEEMIRKQKEEEDRKRREEEARRNNNNNGGGSSNGGSSGGTTVTPGGPAVNGYARYVWPAPGCTVITSYWGDGRNHQGLDLACYGSAYGKSIVAAASGTVTIANSTDSWGSGWGYYIMIDHGGGYSTLYAHCSQVLVSVGQYVSAGQLIGYIGNTGNSYGAHLHFETWHNSTRYNPAPHLGL